MKLPAYILAGLLLATTASAQSVTVKCMGWMASQSICMQKQTDWAIYSIYDLPERLRRDRMIDWDDLQPPAEYDKPFDGELREIIKNPDEIEFLCMKSRLGCSRRQVGEALCLIYLAPDEVIRAYGWTTELVRRHEIAHCNGWGHK
jgi:hypothetical protein